MKYSVVIPARNEERFLGGCIDSILAAKGDRDVEIIVVANRCSDRTEEIARHYGSRIERCEAKNLSVIRNVGIRASAGDVILTVDADSRVSRNVFDAIDNRLSTGKYVGGGVAIIPERISPGILLTGLCILPIAIVNRIAGGLFFFYRTAFNAIRGFDEELVSVEDVDFAKRLRRYANSLNKKFALVLEAHIVTSCRKFDRLGDWYFLLHPLESLRLLGGRNKSAADKIWYDFPRD